MKIKEKGNGCLIFIASFLAITILGIFVSNPPMPGIRYAEFPFRIEIEHKGERLVFEDVIICRFAGFNISYSGGHFRRFRQWRSHFESGRPYSTRYPSLEILHTDYVRIVFYSGEPAFYMDLPWYQLEHGMPRSLMRPSIMVYNLEMRERGEHPSSFSLLHMQHEWHKATLADFGIEVISIELTPPIENTFRTRTFRSIDIY